MLTNTSLESRITTRIREIDTRIAELSSLEIERAALKRILDADGNGAAPGVSGTKTCGPTEAVIRTLKERGNLLLPDLIGESKGLVHSKARSVDKTLDSTIRNMLTQDKLMRAEDGRISLVETED
jgi:hypothetical protein